MSNGDPGIPFDQQEHLLKREDVVGALFWILSAEHLIYLMVSHMGRRQKLEDWSIGRNNGGENGRNEHE
jgi:hypothetical protein